MAQSNVRLHDLPHEILFIILKNLNNMKHSLILLILHKEH